MVLPLLIAGGLMAGAGAAAAGKGLWDQGQIKAPQGPDPNLFKYAGKAQDYYNNQATDASKRNIGVSYGADLNDRYDRAAGEAGGIVGQLMNDHGYSAAQAQQDAASNAAYQQAAALAGNARGGGPGMAAAQSAFAGQGAQMLQNASTAATQARLQELQQNHQIAAGLSGQLAQQALGYRGQDIQMGQFGADFGLRNRSENDQYALGLMGLGQHAADSQAQLQQAQAQAQWNQQMAQYGLDQANAAGWKQLGGALLGQAGGLMGMGLAGGGGAPSGGGGGGGNGGAPATIGQTGAGSYIGGAGYGRW